MDYRPNARFLYQEISYGENLHNLFPILVLIDDYLYQQNKAFMAHDNVVIIKKHELLMFGREVIGVVDGDRESLGGLNIIDLEKRNITTKNHSLLNLEELEFYLTRDGMTRGEWDEAWINFNNKNASFIFYQ